MLTNKQIKSKELYKAQQRYISVCGLFKKAQQDLLVAFNEMAMSEYRGDNALKKAVIEHKGKSAIKYYFAMFKDKVILEETIATLKQWQPKEE